MNKRTLKLGWLVMAAALMIMMASCTNDDNITDKPTTTTVPQAASTVHVTVGAGIDGDEATTRSAVDDTQTDANGKPIRTLKFTAGDRLCVIGSLYDGTIKYLTGYLDMVGSPINDGASATFSGDLSVVLASGAASTYDFTNAADPLADCSTAKAWLVHAAIPDGFITETINTLVVDQGKMIASDVNTLMTTTAYVRGGYDKTANNFVLNYGNPILNCTINHLTAGTAYTVKLRSGGDYDEYNSNRQLMLTYDAMTVSADASGTAHFAISFTYFEAESHNRYYVLQLIGGGETYEYVLGQKELDAKVYNVTRNSHIGAQAGSIAYIQSKFGLNESTWSQQSAYGLCKFKYQLCTSPGVGISQAPISAITITNSDGRTITVTDTRDNGYGGTLGFDTDFQFYVAMLPFSGKTLTITYDPHNSQYTYVGTVADVTLAGGDVLDLGTVELVKTTL